MVVIVGGVVNRFVVGGGSGGTTASGRGGRRRCPTITLAAADHHYYYDTSSRSYNDSNVCSTRTSRFDTLSSVSLTQAQQRLTNKNNNNILACSAASSYQNQTDLLFSPRNLCSDRKRFFDHLRPKALIKSVRITLVVFFCFCLFAWMVLWWKLCVCACSSRS